MKLPQMKKATSRANSEEEEKKERKRGGEVKNRSELLPFLLVSPFPLFSSLLFRGLLVAVRSKSAALLSDDLSS